MKLFKFYYTEKILEGKLAPRCGHCRAQNARRYRSETRVNDLFWGKMGGGGLHAVYWG